jgi:hypothetical protein
MPLKRGKVESQLKRKFHFVPSKNRSSDHVWLELKLSGVPTIFTKLSHSRDELRAPLINAMARELKVNSQFFIGMIECSKSEADYHRSLADVH